MESDKRTVIENSKILEQCDFVVIGAGIGGTVDVDCYCFGKDECQGL